jgi:DNA adenine methylase
MNAYQPGLKPFLKWAGGKRWLIPKSKELSLPVDKMNRYIEPFLGGGSMFFHLRPQSGLLTDLNSDLINSYTTIRDDWFELYSVLQNYHKQHSETFYYDIRSQEPEIPLYRAARFIYLNRTCWNGLYRVNKNGKFNVPIGTKTNVILQEDNFEALSILLQTIELKHCDFEETINQATENDFLFIDPPYTVKHNLNGFVKYNETIFSWQDQIRLKECVKRAINRGANVLVTNANHKSIIELYEGVGNFHYVERASVIAGNLHARGRFSEVIIKSW